MAEYIVDTAITRCEGYCPSNECIVRCRDCKHCVNDGDYDCYLPYCSELQKRVKPDGFCAWGEER